MGQDLVHCQCDHDAVHHHRVLLSDVFREAVISRFPLGDHCAALHVVARADVAKEKPGGLHRPGGKRLAGKRLPFEER